MINELIMGFVCQFGCKFNSDRSHSESKEISYPSAGWGEKEMPSSDMRTREVRVYIPTCLSQTAKSGMSVYLNLPVNLWLVCSVSGWIPEPIQNCLLFFEISEPKSTGKTCRNSTTGRLTNERNTYLPTNIGQYILNLEMQRIFLTWPVFALWHIHKRQSHFCALWWNVDPVLVFIHDSIYTFLDLCK